MAKVDKSLAEGPLDIEKEFDSADIQASLADTIYRLENGDAKDSEHEENGSTFALSAPLPVQLKRADDAEKEKNRAARTAEKQKATVAKEAARKPPPLVNDTDLGAPKEKSGFEYVAPGSKPKKPKKPAPVDKAAEKEQPKKNGKDAVEMVSIPTSSLRALANLAGIPYVMDDLSTEAFVRCVGTYIYNTYAYKGIVPNVSDKLVEKNGSGCFGFAFWTGALVQETGKYTADAIMNYARKVQRGARYNVMATRANLVIRDILSQPEIAGRTYMIGKTTCPKNPRSKSKGLIRAGMVKRFGSKYSSHGYKYLIALAIFDRDSAESVGEHGYDNPEQEAVETEAALFQIHEKFPDFDCISNIQSGSRSSYEPHEIYAITYLAIGPPVDKKSK